MGERLFHVQRDRHPCPKCGNKRDFLLKAQQVAEDYCHIWVTCICRYDPFENKPNHMIEDVWGELDAGNAFMSLEIWNELVPP